MANVGPTKWYVDSVAWTAVTAWSTPLTPAAGSLIRQSAAPSVGNERVFVCIVSGAVGGAEPAWVVTKGGKTTDNAATWQECSGQPGVNGDTVNSPTWLQNKNTTVSLGLIIFDSVTSSLQIVSTNGTTGNGAQPGFSATAGTTTGDNTVTWTSLGLASAFAGWAAPHARLQNAFAANFSVAGDTIFIASESAETAAASWAPTFPGTTANPNLIVSVNKAGAVPPVTEQDGAQVLTTGGNNIGPGGAAKIVGVTFSGNQIQLGTNSNSFMHLLNCKLIVGSTALFVGFNTNVRVKLENTTVKFSNTNQVIQVNGSGNSGSFEWLNTPSAIDGTGSIPTTLFSANLSGTGVSTLIHGVDLSAETGNLFDVSSSLPWTAVVSDCKINAAATVKTNTFGSVNSNLTLIDVDSGATGYRNEWHNFYGDITTETTITLKNGASDGVQSVSHKYVTTANATVNNPLIWPLAEKKFGVWNTTTGKAVTITVQIISSGTLNNNDVWLEVEYLGSAASPLSSFANNGLANPLSAPAAQPTSTANWNSQPATPVQQQLSVTVTPQLVGYIYGRIYVGKASTTLYVDPELTLK